MKVAQNVKGGWIQRCNSSSYKFPNSEKALADAVEAAGPAMGPALLNMSEYLMSSFNESYQSRCENLNLYVILSFHLLTVKQLKIISIWKVFACSSTHRYCYFYQLDPYWYRGIHEDEIKISVHFSLSF